MVIEDQLLQATEGPSQHAEHNELRNHTLNVKACYEGKGCLQALRPSPCSWPRVRSLLKVKHTLVGWEKG